MQDIKIKVADETGTMRKVSAIASNEDHIGNHIAEGHLVEGDRWREIARLYKGQLAAKQREVIQLRELLAKSAKAHNQA